MSDERLYELAQAQARTDERVTSTDERVTNLENLADARLNGLSRKIDANHEDFMSEVAGIHDSVDGLAERVDTLTTEKVERGARQELWRSIWRFLNAGLFLAAVSAAFAVGRGCVQRDANSAPITEPAEPKASEP